MDCDACDSPSQRVRSPTSYSTHSGGLKSRISFFGIGKILPRGERRIVFNFGRGDGALLLLESDNLLPAQAAAAE